MQHVSLGQRPYTVNSLSNLKKGGLGCLLAWIIFKRVFQEILLECFHGFPTPNFEDAR